MIRGQKEALNEKSGIVYNRSDAGYYGSYVIDNLQHKGGGFTMDIDKVYTIDEIKEIVVPILSKIGTRKIGLFGSYAKGCAGKNSDIDLLVYLQTVYQQLRCNIGKTTPRGPFVYKNNWKA